MTRPEHVKDSIEHTFQVRIDIVVPNSNDSETVGLQFRIARFVFQSWRT
jgi:hypothetical protein